MASLRLRTRLKSFANFHGTNENGRALLPLAHSHGAMIFALDGKSEWVISGDANQLCAGVDEKTFQVWPGFIFSVD